MQKCLKMVEKRQTANWVGTVARNFLAGATSCLAGPLPAPCRHSACRESIGRFTERWAYLVAEIAGQAAIDVLLGPTD
jgi:hypothetical protein